MRLDRGLTVVLAVLPLLLGGCQSNAPGGGGGGSVDHVTLTPTDATIAVGGTQAFTAVATDTTGATVQTAFVWKSSDDDVATVAGGTATGVSQGSATITASAAGISGTATLTVTTDGGGGGGGDGPPAFHAFLLPLLDSGGEVDNMHDTAIAVDAQGGVHTAYYDFTGDGAVHYYTCPSACTTVAAFAGGIVAQPVHAPSFLNLVLDQEGHPRLLFAIFHGFVYGACDANCTDPSGWDFVVVEGLVDLTFGSNRMLALDAAGRPRFIYNDDNPGHYGTFYVTCDADCMDPNSWTTMPIAADTFIRPSLTIGSDGLARFTFVNEDGFGYLECTALDCSTWEGQTMFPASYWGEDASLRLDASDHPRLALYTGADDPLTLDANTVYYLACDVNCASASNSSWGAIALSQGQSSEQRVALALGSAGQPRIALTTDDGLLMAACDVDCVNTGDGWSLTLLETEDDLAAEQPVPVVECAPLHWTFADQDPGTGLSLALDANAQPRLGYDIRYLVLCPGAHVHASIIFPRFGALTLP